MTQDRPSEGLCYGCRHADDDRLSTTAGDDRLSVAGHCHGAGHLEGNTWWPGFVCVCPCTKGQR